MFLTKNISIIMNDKDLLLQDICARLPYGVHVEYKGEIYGVLGISFGRLTLCKPFMSQTLEYHPLVEEVKPCLFPLSSIPENVVDEIYNECGIYDVYDLDSDPIIHIEVGTKFGEITKLFNILNKHHIDYNNLIPKGSAIDAAGLNIY